jgi:hypothetical protein
VKPMDPLHSLQLGPVWMLSAIAGTGTTFSPLDRDAFWETVHSVTLRTPTEARVVLESVLHAGPDLFLDFELDDRPLASGLRNVCEVLDGMDSELAADYKLALLRIGVGLAKARGPYGRQVSAENEQLLLLLAELLDLRSTSEATG